MSPSPSLWGALQSHSGVRAPHPLGKVKGQFLVTRLCCPTPVAKPPAEIPGPPPTGRRRSSHWPPSASPLASFPVPTALLTALRGRKLPGSPQSLTTTRFTTLSGTRTLRDLRVVPGLGGSIFAWWRSCESWGGRGECGVWPVRFSLSATLHPAAPASCSAKPEAPPARAFDRGLGRVQ